MQRSTRALPRPRIAAASVCAKFCCNLARKRVLEAASYEIQRQRKNAKALADSFVLSIYRTRLFHFVRVINVNRLGKFNKKRIRLACSCCVQLNRVSRINGCIEILVYVRKLFHFEIRSLENWRDISFFDLENCQLKIASCLGDKKAFCCK